MINKQPLIKFSLWFITGLFIMFWGITHPAAASYNYEQFMAQLYDNYGPTLSAVTTNQTNNRWEGTIPDMTAWSSGAAWGISSPVVLIAGHTYSLTAKITGYYGGNIVKSTYDRIGVGDTLNNAKISYQNNSNVNELYSSSPQTYGLIQFAFTTNVNGNYIVFPFATSYTGSNQTFWLENIVIDDLGASGVSQSQITNSLNNQTNTINNSITNSENNIKSNSNKNKQEIIDNQNENSNKINDTLNSGLNNVCSNLINVENISPGRFNNNTDILDSNAIIKDVNTNIGYVNFQTTSTWEGFHTDYLKVNSGENMILSFDIDNNETVCGLVNYYYSNKGFIQQVSQCSTGSLRMNLNIPGNASYARVSFSFSSIINDGYIRRVTFSQDGSFCPFGKTTSKLDETNDAINGVNGTLNDDNVDSSSWANFFNNFTTNTFGLTSIVTAPLNLIQSLTSSSCTDLQLPLPYLQNKYLTLPCMTTIYSQYFGTFFILYQTITYGIIAYWVCVRIFNLVKDFKNPDHDEIEVVDL